MTHRIESFYDLGRMRGLEDGKKEGEQRGEQRGIRNMLKNCIVLRFPQTSQTTINNILSITDSKVLESIFNVAYTSDSLDAFQKNIRGIAPIN